MSNATVSALGYLEVGVASLDDWQSFATEVLGVAAERTEDALLLRYDAACWRIRLVETDEDDIRCAGFEVADPQTLEELADRLQALGFSIRAGSAEEAAARQVEALVVCEDPFGLPVELYVGERTTSAACDLPLPDISFVTGNQGLGHMVLYVGDQAQAERFYMEGLGMKLSDHILLGPPDKRFQLTFLHCNPRHHTLALAPAPVPKRLNHIMLQVQSLDAVGHGLDRANGAAVPIANSLGKHTNDEMVSFYMTSPSGFEIEYGHGGIEIDDTTWETGKHYATSFWGHKGALN